MTDAEMMEWLGERYRQGSVPFPAYDRANSAMRNGRSDEVRAVYEQYAPHADRLRAQLAQLQAEVERLNARNAAYREIVDALANEAHYQAETGEGSMAYLARLVTKAKALLASENAR